MLPAITKSIFLVPAKTGAYFMESNKQETRSRERTLFYPQPSSTCKTCPLGKLPGFQIGTLDTTATARESGRPTENSAMLQKSGVLKLKTPVLGFNLHQSDDSWNDSSINFTHRPRVRRGCTLRNWPSQQSGAICSSASFSSNPGPYLDGPGATF